MDRYIDNTETQTYGPALVKRLHALGKGADKPVREFLTYLAAQVAKSTDDVAAR